MPPKTVKCDICGEEVLKRQTLAIADGKRACRSHEETEDKATDQQNKIKAEQQRKLKALEKRKFPKSNNKFVFGPKCSKCCKLGVRQQEFFLNILIAWQKYEITYGKPLNPFDPKENMKACSELMGSRCLCKPILKLI